MTHEITPKLKGMPFYAVPGNHDIKNQKDEVDLTEYRKVFGADYYWFSYGDILFVWLNNSDKSIGDEQFEWLRMVWEKVRPQFKTCVVFAHIPPYDVEGIPHHSMVPEAAVKLKKLLAKHRVDLVLFGHVHNYTEGKFAGAPMYTLLSSGQEIRSFVNKFGYVEVEIPKVGQPVVTPVYTDNVAQGEFEDVFLTDNILSTKARVISISLIGVGCLLLLWSRKRQQKQA